MTGVQTCALRSIILRGRNFVFNAADVLAVFVFMACHWHFRAVLVFVIHRFLLLVLHDLGYILCASLVQADRMAQIAILVSGHAIHVKTQHIAVPNAIGQAVAVNFIAENVAGRGILALVFVENGCAGKAEEKRLKVFVPKCRVCGRALHVL